MEYAETEGRHLLRLMKEPAIRKDDLVQPDWNMLRSCRIPHVLQVEGEEWNGEAKLVYDRTFLRTLASQLHKPLEEPEVLRFFIALTAVLEQAGRYLLSLNGFVTNPDCLFIGTGIDDLHLLYIPLKQMKELPPIHERLRTLLRQMTAPPNQSTTELRTLLDGFTQEDFNPGRMRMALAEYADNRPVANGRLEPIPTGADRMVLLPAKEPVTMTNSFKKAGYEPGSTGKKLLVGKAKQTGRSPAGTAGITVLLLAVCWIAYGVKSSEGMLYLSIGITLLALDGAYVWTIWQKRDLGTSLKPGEEKGNPDRIREQYPDQNHERNSKAEGTISAVSPETYYASLPAHTQLLASPGIPHDGQATVLLRKESVSPPIGFLEFDRNGDKERVPVIIPKGESAFLIGREPDLAHYSVSKMEISRRHAEIRQMEGAYLLRDLGSKNGTVHNGRALLPYQEYPLAEGDEIDAADVRFVFRMGI